MQPLAAIDLEALIEAGHGDRHLPVRGWSQVCGELERRQLPPLVLTRGPKGMNVVAPMGSPGAGPEQPESSQSKTAPEGPFASNALVAGA